MKICDPAVGSGHFLVSVLNYIVALKSELGLLSIKNKIEIQNDTLVIYESDGETQFEYKRNNRNSLLIQKAIFDEKRKIIENCLFGVDINPNSVQICCLRLWIELLKNTYYVGNTDEMQILPNIDINIKCGNSLVSAYDISVTEYLKDSIEYKPAISGMMNIYKFFLLRSFNLLKQNGVFIQIFPLTFACDTSLKELRQFVFNNYSILNIEAFPERDSTKRRVFEHAKVSVCIVSAIKKISENATFFLRKNSDKFVDFNTSCTPLNLSLINELDDNLTIPLASTFDIELLQKIKKISMPLSNIAHCYTGEIDISINAKYITNDISHSEMIKGAIIDKYQKRNEMSQGEIQFLNSEKYLMENKSGKSQHYKNDRIVMQGLTGVNEEYRLKSTIIQSGIFCANSVNYLYFTNCDINKKFILGLLNSSLMNYIFKISSTNSNVNGYEVDALPIIVPDINIQNQIADIVDRIIIEKQNAGYNAEFCKNCEKEIDKKIFNLYGLTNEEQKIILKNK